MPFENSNRSSQYSRLSQNLASPPSSPTAANREGSYKAPHPPPVEPPPGQESGEVEFLLDAPVHPITGERVKETETGANPKEGR